MLTSPIDGDLGAILGWGFGPFTGGPFSFIDTIGLKAFVSKADELKERYGQGFDLPQSIREMADQDKTFYR